MILPVSSDPHVPETLNVTNESPKQRHSLSIMWVGASCEIVSTYARHDS